MSFVLLISGGSQDLLMKTRRLLTHSDLSYPIVFFFQCALMSDVFLCILVAALHLVNGILGELPR